MSNSTIRHLNIKDYESAAKYLSGKKSRPCGHNTRIEYDTLNMGHNVITITYHDNVIVNYYPDKITLHNQGWFTSTTKERLNHFIPARFSVYQERGQWFVIDRGEPINYDWNSRIRYVWAEGITLSNDGVFNAGSDSDVDATKALTKQIHKYVNGFVQALINRQIEKPSGGDCWYCCMVTDDGQSLGDKTHNTEHIISHMEESYYVPSLLMNAIKVIPVCAFTKTTIGELLGYLDDKPSDWQLSLLERDLTSVLTRYLKRELGIAA